MICRLCPKPAQISMPLIRASLIAGSAIRASPSPKPKSTTGSPPTAPVSPLWPPHFQRIGYQIKHRALQKSPCRSPSKKPLRKTPPLFAISLTLSNLRRCACIKSDRLPAGCHHADWPQSARASKKHLTATPVQVPVRTGTSTYVSATRSRRLPGPRNRPTPSDQAPRPL